MCFTQTVTTSDEPSLHGKLLMEYSPSRGEVTFSRLMSGHVNILYSALIRREAILRAGNFDPDFRISEDFDLWIRILKSGGHIAYHRIPLVHYRKRAGSLTSASLRTCEWILRVLDKTERTLELTDEEAQSLNARRGAVQMERELLLGKQAVQLRDWREPDSTSSSIGDIAPVQKCPVYCFCYGGRRSLSVGRRMCETLC